MLQINPTGQIEQHNFRETSIVISIQTKNVSQSSLGIQGMDLHCTWKL